METTIFIYVYIYLFIQGFRWGYIVVMLGLCWGYIRIMENKMETTL